MHILLQRGIAYRYDDNGGGGGFGEVLSFWILIGMGYLIYTTFQKWDKKSHPQDDRKSEPFIWDEPSDIELQIEIENDFKLKSYGSSPQERRVKIENEAKEYIRAFRTKTGFEKYVSFLYTYLFLHEYQSLERPRLISSYAIDFLRSRCPEGVEWLEKSRSRDPDDHTKLVRTDEFRVSWDEAYKRFNENHILGDENVIF